ncbi:MarR family transcriptional regulator [Brevibacillus agri]|uniref:MarR family transcriptional regulator n=2 Tax=Brevibacillus TaxID=55080 RepID=A0A3M8ANF2_9BACL|nr:transcriptional regulator [Brevibacillus sp. CF112]ELK43976.1 transcriptional regulator [Brevibacillus agri BAB-2500]MBG9568163.1 transcriptional regulator [Brevibacillus agri]MDT7985703.1 MarR family transcriptional regulator [Clostridium perfringens]QHZ58516.1 MarR family transcriptional regulator [Brevibacillus sp. NSP2.1]
MIDHWQHEPIGFLIGNTYRRMIHYVSLFLREFDLTTEQFAVLYRLREEDGINQKELALRSAKDQPTMTRILDNLAKKGWIEKKLSEHDRRAYLITLTPNGREWIEKAIPAEAKAIADIFAGISPEKLAFLREILLEINENVNRHTQE